MCKKNSRQTFLASVVVILMIQSAVKFVKVEANYAVSLGIHGTSHPGNNFTDGTCCDSQEESGNCTSPCNNVKMRICLVPRGSNNCSNQLWTTIVNTSPRGISSPLISQPWPVSTGIEIFINVFKEVGISMKLTIDDISGVVVNRTVGDVSSPNREYFGDNLIFSVTLSFRVICSTNFYGDDCNTFCESRNDSSGHFTCDEDDGSIVCLEGYQNETTNCIECITSENCSSDGGFCELPGECRCRNGFTGINCEIAPTSTISPSQLPPNSQSSSLVHTTTSPSPPGLRETGSGVNINAAVGGTIGVLVLLIFIMIVIIGVMIVIKKHRDKKTANKWLVHVQSNRGTGEDVVLTGVGGDAQGNDLARNHHTPEYLVVPAHNQQRLTVPAASTYVTAVSTPESKRMHIPKPQQWYEEPNEEDNDDNDELPISPVTEDTSSMTQISSAPREDDTVIYSDIQNVPKTTHNYDYLNEVEGELGQLQEKSDLQYTTVTFGSPTN